MSIVKNYGMNTPVCDVCDLELLPLYDFHAAIEQKKQAGWKSKKTGEVDERGKEIWIDLCPDCQV